MKLIAGLLLIVIALLSLMLYHSYQPERWSYKVLVPKDEVLMEELNQAGSLGYEVISARRSSAGEPYEMILKRRGAPEPTRAQEFKSLIDKLDKERRAPKKE